MSWLDITISILTVVVGLILIIVVMLQDSKDGKSSAVANNTFYGANKSQTLDGALSKATVVIALLFIILCVATTIVLMK